MINKAIAFALKAHEGQLRKGTNLPFIVHPLEVGVIVSRMTDEQEVIAAAILHDTMEDCKAVTCQLLCHEFGERVAKIVRAESEEKGGTWNERKARTLERLKREKDSGIKLVALGDKLSNARSLRRDYERLGDRVWLRFNMKDKSMQAWYYRGLCEALGDMKAFPEYRELCEQVSFIFKDVDVIAD